MKVNIILFLAIAVCNVIANCPIEGKVYVRKTAPLVPIDNYNNFILLVTTEKLYSCKATDEEGQDLSCNCIKLKEKGNYNCTCFGVDLPTSTDQKQHYLDCLDALRKGRKKNGVYSLKPDNLSPFKV